jgi:hypothetical protein
MVARFAIQVPATEAICKIIISMLEALSPRSRLRARDDLIIVQLAPWLQELWYKPQQNIAAGTSHQAKPQDFVAQRLCLCISLHVTDHTRPQLSVPSCFHDPICSPLQFAIFALTGHLNPLMAIIFLRRHIIKEPLNRNHCPSFVR